MARFVDAQFRTGAARARITGRGCRLSGATRSRSPAGKRCRAAAGTELWISALLDASAAAELVIYADPARGTFRYASVVGSRLDACLFIASKASSLPSRDALAALLGTRIESDMRAYLLAGQAAWRRGAECRRPNDLRMLWRRPGYVASYDREPRS